MDETGTEHDPQQRREALASAGETREDSLRGIVAAGAAALATEIAAGKSERLLAYRAFSARLYRYSAHNQILIAVQCPEATFVAGYSRWQRFGYQVRRGERGIRIVAPRPFQKGRDGAHEEEEIGVYFVAVAVFDLSQVEPIAGTAHTPIQQYFTPLGNEATALVERLGEIVVGDGIAVSEADGLGQVQGYSAGGRIVIKAGLDATNRFLTLVHEYGHELLHQHETGTRAAFHQRMRGRGSQFHGRAPFWYPQPVCRRLSANLGQYRLRTDGAASGHSAGGSLHHRGDRASRRAKATTHSPSGGGYTSE